MTALPPPVQNQSDLALLLQDYATMTLSSKVLVCQSQSMIRKLREMRKETVERISATRSLLGKPLPPQPSSASGSESD